MALLIGTREGVFRSADGMIDDIEQVLDAGNTLRVRTFEMHEGVFATTKTGLYRSTDDGTSWENLDVPREEVFPQGFDHSLHSRHHPTSSVISVTYLRAIEHVDEYNENTGLRCDGEPGTGSHASPFADTTPVRCLWTNP
jgi:hypothetical protein